MRRWLILSFFLLASVGVTVWVTGMDRIGVMTPFTYEEIFLEIRVHLLDLVFPSVLIATVIAVLVGILITRTGFKRLGSPIMAVASAAMSIPSMGVLAIMVPVLIALDLPPYGILPGLIALVTWGVLPILRNTYAGINNISPGILEAARGMGMTRGQIARRIELPLALPVIMAGIRVTTVILVGTAALAVIVGAGGLGRIILAGVNNRVPLITLQGAAPVAAIAIILSTVLGYVDRRLTPRGMRIETAF
jgi:osmoprotectant transport system permease protein